MIKEACRNCPYFNTLLILNELGYPSIDPGSGGASAMSFNASRVFAEYSQSSARCPGVIDTGETQQVGVLWWKKQVPVYKCGLGEVKSQVKY